MVTVADGRWNLKLQQLGNIPGDNQGRVLITNLASGDEAVCDTTDVTILGDIGVYYVLPDGRQKFSPLGMTSIEDAPGERAAPKK